MVGGVAAIAQRNQVRRFIRSTGGPRNQMVDVGFPWKTHGTAGSAHAAVSGKDNLPNLAPVLVLLYCGIVGRWSLRPQAHRVNLAQT